jgi:hypothetical protein
MPQNFNVLIVAEFKDISEEALKNILLRLEEHGLERIPTLTTAWEYATEADDEATAKDRCLQEFVNVCRTSPAECALVVHAGTSQIIRRRKKFES